MTTKRQSSFAKGKKKMFTDIVLPLLGTENQKLNGSTELKECKTFFLKQNLLPSLCLVKLRFCSMKAGLIGQATVRKFGTPC